MPWGALAAGIAATASTIGSSQQAGAAKDAGMQEDAAKSCACRSAGTDATTASGFCAIS